MSIPVAPPEATAANVATLTHLGDSGIVLGEYDEVGVFWKRTDSNSWGPKPEPREQTGDRAYDNGQWDATRFYGPRQLEIRGSCRAPDHASLHWAEQRLRDTIGVTPIAVRVVEPYFDGYTYLRQQGQILWNEITNEFAQFSIGLYGPDPLIYSTLDHAFTLGFPTRSGGLIWPATWPSTWTGTVVDGRITVVNAGNIPLPIEVDVTGPVNNFRIVNTTTGQALTINNPDGATLTAGQDMTIDTARHQVLLMGTASRRGWASGQWPLLAPGANILAITGDDTNTDSNVSGSYRAVRL